MLNKIGEITPPCFTVHTISYCKMCGDDVTPTDKHLLVCIPKAQLRTIQI